MDSGTSRYLILFFLIVVQFGQNQCWRSSRPSYPSRRPTSSPYRPFPTHAPTHRPFPTYRPAPTRAPTYRPFPTHAPTYRPFPTHAPTYRPSPTHAPTYRPSPTHAPTYRPFPTHRPHPTSAPTYRPYPTSAPTYRPYPTHSPTFRPSPAHYPTYRPTTRYPTQRYPTGPHPTYPGFSHGGVSPPKYNQPTYSVPVPGTNKVKVYNINNYHSPSYYAPPSYPIYHYSHRDTGDTTLGLYLGYRLGRISHPTYYHQDHRFYDGYSPRYDHYTVHHYYHNSESIPRQQTINTKVIIQCGDGTEICPANTTSLCTANGQIMCVVVATETQPCESNPSLRCVESTIPCENNQTAECKGVEKGKSATISIPCISNTVVEGSVTTVNNSIVAKNPWRAKSAFKSVVPIETSSVSTTIVTTPTTISTATTPAATSTATTPAATTPAAMSTATTPALTTPVSIETTTSNETFPSLAVRTKRDAAPLQYCVTVVAEPSKRTATEGEQVFREITSIFDQFFSKAFGMDKVGNPPQKNVNYVPDLGN